MIIVFFADLFSLICCISGASADAQICAQEAVGVEGVSSDDDGQDMNFKRASNGEGTRKRRVVLDFSDDDDEDAVNLASPDPGKSGRDLKESIETLVPEKSNLNFDELLEDKLKVKENVTVDQQSNPVVKEDSSAVTNDKTTRTSPKEKTRNSVPENDVNKKNKLTKTAPDSPKRRKVLKTRIDERGREGTLLRCLSFHNVFFMSYRLCRNNLTKATSSTSFTVFIINVSSFMVLVIATVVVLVILFIVIMHLIGDTQNKLQFLSYF